jgi:hypothetical protein
MDLTADPQIANSTALVATTIEDLWPAATYSPIQAFEAKSAPKIYKITAGGTITFGTASTLIITPQTTTSGNTLGASAAISCPVSVGPFPWYLEATFVVRTTGTAGTMMGTGVFVTNGILANTSPGANLIVPFGGTSATFDTTVLNGITIRKTLSVAGSVTPMYAFMQSVN